MSGDLVLARLGQARTALAKAVRDRNIPKLKELRDLGKSAMVWVKERKLGYEAQKEARSFVLLTDRNIYRLQAMAPKNKGTRGRILENLSTGGGKFPPPVNDAPTLKDTGIDKDAAKEIRAVGKLTDEEFQQVVEEGVSPGKVVRESRKKKKKEREAKFQAEAKKASEEGDLQFDLLRGDFRKVLRDLANSSVDLILTDPTYGYDAISLYADLGKFAAQKLKPGGSLIAYCGQSTLIECGNALGAHLRYWWTIALLHRSGLQQLPGKWVQVRWKPLLWFVKEKRSGNAYIDDVINGTPPRKDLHDWAQGLEEIKPLIERLTAVRELVVDPFAGSGTTGRAANELGRRFVGADDR